LGLRLWRRSKGFEHQGEERGALRERTGGRRHLDEEKQTHREEPNNRNKRRMHSSRLVIPLWLGGKLETYRRRSRFTPRMASWPVAKKGKINFKTKEKEWKVERKIMSRRRIGEGLGEGGVDGSYRRQQKIN